MKLISASSARSSRAAASVQSSSPAMLTALSIFALLLLAAFVGPASAAGLDKANEGVQKVIDTLNLISIGVVTIAFIFAGYQIAFNQKRFMDVAPIFVGGIIVGAAAQIATFLIQ